MNIVIIGTGYVSLVAGGCFAEIGHHVTCVDICPNKINGLKQGQLPIYEPGLDDIVARNTAAGRLHFTTNLADAAPDADAYCIAVGTPPDEDGSADLQYVLAAAREIGRHLARPAVIINKSTVPVGTAEKVRAVIAEALAAAVPGLDSQIHVEPIEDPRSYEDIPEGSLSVGNGDRPSPSYEESATDFSLPTKQAFDGQTMTGNASSLGS